MRMWVATAPIIVRMTMMAPTTAREVPLAMAAMRRSTAATSSVPTDENTSHLRLDGGQPIARELDFVGTDVGDLGAAGADEGNSEDDREDRGSRKRLVLDPCGIRRIAQTGSRRTRSG